MSRHRAPSASSRALTVMSLTGVTLGLSLGTMAVPALASPATRPAPQVDFDLDGKDKKWDKSSEKRQEGTEARSTDGTPRKAKSKAGHSSRRDDAERSRDSRKSDAEQSRDSRKSKEARKSRDDRKSSDGRRAESREDGSRSRPKPNEFQPGTPNPTSYLTPRPQHYKPDPDADEDPYYKDYGAPYNPHRHRHHRSGHDRADHHR